MLQEILKNRKIILASGSPRRQQFLKNLDIDFEIRVKEVDEVYPNHLVGAEITEYLCNLKASVFTQIETSEIIVTADTIVWLDNEALGKPKNNEEAFQMIRKMSGKTHSVFSSFSLKTNSNQIIESEETKVTFLDLSDTEIWYYVNNYKPFDKAGAYGIQEWIGLIAIEKMEGSYTNVVGLPTHKFYKALQRI